MFESGLEFLRADFHLHTQKDKEFSYSGEPNDFVKSYISALKQANISVGVITNHNKFDKDCIFRKNCASVPEERSAIPLQTEQSSAG